MQSKVVRIAVETTARAQLVEVTDEVRAAARASGVRDGVLVVYCPHTTAGVTVQENADPDVRHDLLLALETAVPQRAARGAYRHGEGNSDAHVKASIVGSSATLLLEGGEPQLGTWQGVFLCEFDGPRHRTLLLKVLGALALALSLAACAGPRGASPAAGASPRGDIGVPRAEEVRFERETVVEVTPADLDLASKNDEELFAIGTAAYAAGDFRRAAGAFGRVADLHPASRHHAAALFDAGLAHERLQEWRLALGRFRALAQGYTGPDADEASFHAAAALWHLGELEEARALLDALARRGDLGVSDRVRALTERGVVELDLGDLDGAERSLRLAVSAWTEASSRERLDDYHVAQAHVALGDVARRRYQAVSLDPSRDTADALAASLEEKARRLLDAQGHYLRAIRVGNPDWAVVAGFRVGELYDDLHARLADAPLPPGLSPEEQAAYRGELRRKLRVLLQKALAVHEQTLQWARQAGVENAFVERTQASLERLKRLLVEAEAPAGAAP
jgi:secondary thiamine-phosphate synthase enzyme